MHIVHLSWEFPPVVYGGLGRHVHALAVAQAARGHTVTVVTQQSETAAAEEDVEGVHVVRVAPDGPFPYHLPSLLTWVGHLDQRIGEAATGLAGADVVHAHDWVVGRAGTASAEALGVPMVATVHATEAGRHSGWLPDAVSGGVHLIEQWLVDEADEVIVCSRAMADEVVRAHGARPEITVIPNGIDATRYRRRDELPAELTRGSPRLTFVGRIEWEKGVFEAVNAMPEVLARYPDARLRMVGTGGQVDALRSRIADARLEDHVEVLGHVDEMRLHALYTSSDIALLPSTYEPFGLVALEAAAMQVPLIVGDTGGLADFVTADRGRRCRPGDARSLAGQILAALADPADTARRAARARAALVGYRWPDIAERTEAVYARARHRPNPPRCLGLHSPRIW